MNDLSNLPPSPVRVDTSIGALMLHPQRFEDIGPYSKLPADDLPSSRLRRYLPHIASWERSPDAEERRPRIDDAACQQLSDDDLERIAEAYLSMPEVRKVAGAADDRAIDIDRAQGESATAYVDRLLQAQHERQLEDVPATYAVLRKRYGAPFSNALADLERQALALKAAAQQMIDERRLVSFDVPTIPAVVDAVAGDSPSPEAATAAVSGGPASFAEGRLIPEALEAANVRRNRDRDEAIDLTRGIARITTQSAILLASASESVTEFLRQVSETAQQSERTTRKSLRMAIVAVAVAALFATGAAVVAVMSYQQVSENNRMTDQVRQAVLQTAKESAAMHENQLKQLDEKIRELAAREQALRLAAAPPPASATPEGTGDSAAPTRRDTTRSSSQARASASKRKAAR
jgi:hypothetical protein